MHNFSTISPWSFINTFEVLIHLFWIFIWNKMARSRPRILCASAAAAAFWWLDDVQFAYGKVKFENKKKKNTSDITFQKTSIAIAVVLPTKLLVVVFSLSFYIMRYFKFIPFTYTWLKVDLKCSRYASLVPSGWKNEMELCFLFKNSSNSFV